MPSANRPRRTSPVSKTKAGAACRISTTTAVSRAGTWIGPRSNAEEAARVREIFQMYLTMGSMLPVVEELERRGWLTKTWKTKSGRPKGGRPFDRGSLHALLKNPLYIGKLKHKKNLYVGEHDLIVQPDVFQKVQTLLLRNRHSGSSKSRNP